jgi:peptide/nickel transport system substrate-binding protein
MTRVLRAICLALVVAAPARAEPAHGIAMYGEPALPPDFVSLPYANPEAPQGGTITFGEVGGFDSLNPYILAGRAPWGIQVHVFETLMARNWDEPFSLYGLIAESMETAPDRSWVEFTLREEARFSDGTPVTVEDVIWSMETLADEGLPRYRNAWEKVETVETTGPRSVRFTFNAIDRELPLIIGLRPILKKADWEGVDFAASSLRVPVGSGPYTIGAFEPGRFIAFERDPDYWGADLPYNAGLHNFDTIRYEYFVDAGVLFQAFTAGALSVYREANPVRWNNGYSFPAVTSGEIVKAEIPHGRPAGMEGFVFNTRREIFADWRVREALIHAFNFEFVNRTLNDGVFPRRTSYFANSPSRWRTAPPGPRSGRCSSPSRANSCRTRSRPTRCRCRTVRSATARTCAPLGACSTRPAGRSRAAPAATKPASPKPSRSCSPPGRARRWPTSMPTRCASSASRRASASSTRPSTTSGATPTTST